MERKNRMIQKIFMYGLLLITISLGYLSYHLYQENQSFKYAIGLEFRKTVERTLDRINENDVSHWVETLKNDEDGDVQLEHYIGELNALVWDYRKMDSASFIGQQINNLIVQYSQLKGKLDAERSIETYKEEIFNNIQFIRHVLVQVQADLGEDGSEILWYKELTYSETKTREYILKEYNHFLRENQ